MPYCGHYWNRSRNPYRYGTLEEIIPWIRQRPERRWSSSMARRHPRQYGETPPGTMLTSQGTTLEKATMIEPKLEVPAELRDLAEKTIDQAEKAFGMFFDAAGKSMTSMPGAGTEISRQALSFTE